MEVKNIILKLGEKGYLASKDLIDFLKSFDDEKIEKFFKYLPPSSGLKKLELNVAKKVMRKISIFNNFIYMKKPIPSNESSVSDIVDIIKNRFEKLSSIIYEKINDSTITSINKVKTARESFSIIGVVTDVDDINHRIKLDDGTGVVTIDISGVGNVIETGEVIGVKCKKINNNTVAIEVIYPDIPIINNTPFGVKDLNILLFSNVKQRLKNVDFDIAFTISQSSNNDYNIVTMDCCGNKKNVDNLSLIDVDGVLIFFIKVDNEIKKHIDLYGNTEKFMKKVLKRRILLTNNKLLIGYKNDVHLLDKIPHIVIIFGYETTFFNYKSVMVVSLNIFDENNDCLLIDVKNGKVIKCSELNVQ